jgi:gluconokinase
VNTFTAVKLIICMGVSGCGKSTLAQNIAQQLNWLYLEADDFHSAHNKAHMASGKPLTDAMREPWIQSLCDEITDQKNKDISCVLAYSGLRRAHRQRFRTLGVPVMFLYLNGDKAIIAQRMAARTQHFMPSQLLDSQFAALEAPDHEPDIHEIDVNRSVADILNDAQIWVKDFLSHP